MSQPIHFLVRHTLVPLALIVAVCAGLLALPLGASSYEASSPDIVETAVAAGQFETLATALQTAGLVEALQGDGPFTVFAPTDDAFAKLPEGTVEALLQPENRDKLEAILTYHVVPGNLKASAVTSRDGAQTLNGQTVEFMVDSHGAVKVDGAKVVQADVEASNGVIHVIDTVLMPD